MGSENHPGEQWPVTFDNWYTQPDFCRYLDQTLKLAYLGTLAGDDKVNLKTGQVTLAEFAAGLKEEHLKAEKTGGKPVFRPITISFKDERKTYFSYCQTHRIHNFGKQRLVINHRQADLADNPTLRISNRLVWQAASTSRAFVATAGPLKSTTKKARPKG